MILDANFEEGLGEAVLDTAETEVADDVAPRLQGLAEQRWRAYAAENGYDIDHIWQDASVESVTRGADEVRGRVHWPGLTGLFEWGVGPHTIEGNPVLAFTWPAPPEGTRPAGAPESVVADSVNWGSVTGGIPEARAIRDSLRELRAELRG